MHVNIISKYESYAMHALTNSLRGMPGLEITITDEHNPKADLNYHVPYHFIMKDGYDEGLNAILYTHTNPGYEASVAEAASRADLVMAMSYTGRDELLSYGVPAEKIWVACVGVDQLMARRYNVGVIGSTQPNGRKRPQLLLDIFYALPKDLRSIINFMIIGYGWDDYVEQLRAASASVVYADSVSEEEMQNAYFQLDTLLVSSYIEGGPMPLLEALRCGVDVISSKVGYAKDLLGDEYTFETVEECAELLIERMQPKIDRMHLGSLFTWADWMQAHAGAFYRLLGYNPPEDDKFGIGRYNQLIELIAEHKPQSICEIGTWTGFRAVEMLQEAQKHDKGVAYYGYDLFETMTETQKIKEVSKAGVQEAGVNSRISATGTLPHLKKGDTSKTLAFMTNAADFYFIDGGHSEETIQSDWQHVSEAMHAESIVVFDDYYHNGVEGAGCNKVIDNMSEHYKVEHLPFITKTGDSGQMLEVGMVKVTPNG